MKLRSCAILLTAVTTLAVEDVTLPIPPAAAPASIAEVLITRPQPRPTKQEEQNSSNLEQTQAIGQLTPVVTTARQPTIVVPPPPATQVVAPSVAAPSVTTVAAPPTQVAAPSVTTVVVPATISETESGIIAASTQEEKVPSVTRLTWAYSNWEGAGKSEKSMIDHIVDLADGGISDILVGVTHPNFGGGLLSRSGARIFEFTAPRLRDELLEDYLKPRSSRLWLVYSPTQSDLYYAGSAKDEALSIGAYLVENKYHGVVVDFRNLVKSNRQFLIDFLTTISTKNCGVLLMPDDMQVNRDENSTNNLKLLLPKDTRYFIHYPTHFNYDTIFANKNVTGSLKNLLPDNDDDITQFIIAGDNRIPPATVNQILLRAAEDNHTRYNNGFLLVDGLPYPEDRDYETFMLHEVPVYAGAMIGGRRRKDLIAQDDDLVSIPIIPLGTSPRPATPSNFVLIRNCQQEMNRAVSYFASMCIELCTVLTEGKFCQIDSDMADCVRARVPNCKPIK